MKNYVLNTFDGDKFEGIKTTYRSLPKSAELYKYTHDIEYNPVTIYHSKKTGRLYFVVKKINY